MSETFRVGDSVVFRRADGSIWPSLNSVEAADLSFIASRGLKFNAGTLLATVNGEQIRISHPTELDAIYLGTVQNRAARSDRLAKLFERADGHVSDEQINRIEAAIDATPRTCDTCLWWRPPFDIECGNCHNEQVKQLTNIGGETYAPPTPAHFGCVQWESKAQPENGDE